MRRFPKIQRHLLRHLLIMLACSMLCSLLGQGSGARHFSKLASVASSSSVGQLAARVFDLGTDGVVALEAQPQTVGPEWIKDALEVKFLVIQWSALLYRTPVLGWLHRLQKLEDGWRTGGLNRLLSLLDFAVEVLVVFMNKRGTCGVEYRFNPPNSPTGSLALWFPSRAFQSIGVEARSSQVFYSLRSSLRLHTFSRSHTLCSLPWTKRHLPGVLGIAALAWPKSSTSRAGPPIGPARLLASWTKRHLPGLSAPLRPF